MESNTSRVLDRLRGWPWLALALVALLGVLNLAPGQAGVLLWSLSKLTLAAWLGYWIDRSLFQNSRPHQVLEAAMAPGATLPQVLIAAAVMLRRALLVLATILGLGLGV